MTIKKVLALAPHTDDIELGCGGFLSKLKKQSVEIDAISFSSAQPLSVGDPVQEFKDAMSILNIDGEFLGFKPRYFHEKRQDILDYLWNRNKDNEYDLVLSEGVIYASPKIDMSGLVIDYLKKENQ